MRGGSGAIRIAAVLFLATALVLGGCSSDGKDGATGAQGPKGDPGDPGSPGEPGSPGISTAVVSGTVTNSLTGAAVPNVEVAMDPSVDGVSVVTDAQGSYSAQLPIGVYALTFEATNFTPQTETVSLIAGGTATKNVALVPIAPVIITTKVEGEEVPGGDLTLTATVLAMDGSNPVSTVWTQKSGVSLAFPGASVTGQGFRVVAYEANVQTFEGGTLDVTLPGITAFKDEFFRIVDEERHALLNRYMLIGITPLDLEEAGKIVLGLTVTTTKGSYSQDVQVDAALPFKWSGGIRNVGVGVPVLLHGADQESYSWSITGPSASHVTQLEDADTQNPFFTPDAEGKYVVTESSGDVTMDIYAGTWVGAIAPSGDPSNLCTSCHNGTMAPDKFTPWKQSGHAEILTQNLNAGGHYSSACFICHSVGYNPDANNGGFDDAPRYPNFLDRFFPNGGSPQASPDNWATTLVDFPDVARLANVQCENCHGPNETKAHNAGASGADEARMSISSDVCGVCHGEPARHGRFQQWQESGHANYELAMEEATVENRGATASHCGRCHSGQGFLAWIKQDDLTQRIQGAEGDATVEELTALGLTLDTVHPQTCTVCHDPHAQGTTSGEPNTATVRVQNNTAMLPAGFAAKGVGRGALCITCHNTRNGAHNDGTGPLTSYSAPHTAAQGDVLMGQNAYFVPIGDRSPHSFIVDTCTTCHMELTPPPPEFSFSGSGTNHSFKASLSICGQCHGVFDGGTLQTAAEEGLEDLGSTMAAYVQSKIVAAGSVYLKDYTPHEFAGASYDVKSDNSVVSPDNVEVVAPTEPHGQQGFIVRFNTPVDFTYSPSGEDPHTLALTEAQIQLGDFTTDGTAKLVPAGDALVKVGWNYFLIHGDNSKGIHNPAFVFDVLDASTAALEDAMSAQ